jgi:hypothetical protein
MENQNTSASSGAGSSKLWWIIGGVVLVCCCLSIIALVVAGPAVMGVFNSISQSGGLYSGIADEQLKSDVLNAIAGYESETGGCSDVKLFNGQLIASPDQSSDGSWVEMWQVSSCGESHLYSIVFTPSPGGGTDFSVTRAD